MVSSINYHKVKKEFVKIVIVIKTILETTKGNIWKKNLGNKNICY